MSTANDLPAQLNSLARYVRNGEVKDATDLFRAAVLDAEADSIEKGKRIGSREKAAAPKRVEPREESFNATPFSDIEEQSWDFLWPDWLPRGVIVAVDGAPSAGKTYACLDLCARISSGRPWPCDAHATRRPAENIAVMSAEDSAAKTLKRRLRLLGADMTRCINIGDKTLRDRETNEITSVDGSLQDTAALRDVLERHRPALWVIDTLGHFLGPDASPNDESDIKRVLRPVKELAEEFECSFLLIRHHNKSSGTSAVMRGAGSIAITGQARMLWCFGRHKDDQERRALFCGKSNVGREPEPLEYKVDAATGEFSWVGETDMVIADVLGEQERPSSRRAKRDDAVEWLAAFFADGKERRQEVVKAASAEAGFGWRTLQRAADEVGITREGQYAKGRAGCTHFLWSPPSYE